MVKLFSISISQISGTEIELIIVVVVGIVAVVSVVTVVIFGGLVVSHGQ